MATTWLFILLNGITLANGPSAPEFQFRLAHNESYLFPDKSSRTVRRDKILRTPNIDSELLMHALSDNQLRTIDQITNVHVRWSLLQMYREYLRLRLVETTFMRNTDEWEPEHLEIVVSPQSSDRPKRGRKSKIAGLDFAVLRGPAVLEFMESLKILEEPFVRDSECDLFFSAK